LQVAEDAVALKLLLASCCRTAGMQVQLVMWCEHASVALLYQAQVL
jgi:hypothetical protein